MDRRSLSCNWTEEDQRTRAKWMRAMVVFYGCLGLLVLGLIVLAKPSSVVPNGAADRQTWRAGLPGEQVIAMPTCPGKRDENCTTRPIGK
jgi:hypothetical protein